MPSVGGDAEEEQGGRRRWNGGAEMDGDDERDDGNLLAAADDDDELAWTEWRRTLLVLRRLWMRGPGIARGRGDCVSLYKCAIPTHM